MRESIKKIIFVIFAIGWSLQIIGDVFQKDSVAANIWSQYNAILLLIVISVVTIIITLYAAYLYVREYKAEAYKFLVIALAINLIEGIIETVLVTSISKEMLTNWILVNRQDRGLPLTNVPTAVIWLTWGYLVGIIIYGVILYFVYRHWRKLTQVLQTKRSSAVIKQRRKNKKKK